MGSDADLKKSSTTSFRSSKMLQILSERLVQSWANGRESTGPDASCCWLLLVVADCC